MKTSAQYDPKAYLVYLPGEGELSGDALQYRLPIERTLTYSALRPSKARERGRRIWKPPLYERSVPEGTGTLIPAWCMDAWSGTSRPRPLRRNVFGLTGMVDSGTPRAHRADYSPRGTNAADFPEEITPFGVKGLIDVTFQSLGSVFEIGNAVPVKLGEVIAESFRNPCGLHLTPI